MTLNLLANDLGKGLYYLRASQFGNCSVRHVLHKNEKFVASDTADYITRAEELFYCIGGTAHNAVADHVTKAVVYLFEIVNVDDDKRTVLFTLGKIFLAEPSRCSRIEESCQRIFFGADGHI